RILSLLLLCFIALCSHSFAQNFLYVVGYVNDLENVNISLEGTSFGTTTDENGYYELLICKADKFISINYSIIGYSDTIVKLNTSHYEVDTIYLNITMRELQYLLPEVPIRMNKYFFVTNDKAILDIYFLEDVIVILTSNLKDKTSLVIVDYDGQFLNEQFLSRKFNAFYKDCFDNMILVGREVCLQLRLLSSSMNFEIIEEIEISDFYGKLEPCVFAKEDFYLFREPKNEVNEFAVDQFHNKKERYFSIILSDSAKKRSPFYEFFDKVAFAQAQDVFQEIIVRYNQTTPENENILKLQNWDGRILRLINNDFKLFNLISWYQKIEARPIIIAPFFYNDTLYFINNSNGSITLLNKAMDSIDRKNLIYPPEVSFSNLNNIERDFITNEAFAIFDMKGYKWIGNINLTKGSISKLSLGCSIKDLKFFKINNGLIYCIYYDSERKEAIIKHRKLVFDEIK
ncbi:MAG: carboxypeptidase-like regulatory domain-containing protein, partial [Tissierellales bacterium]|nr:carboxypeptidase-like regulatory domain-containing protein [Tissierellales bacterium]